MDMTSLKTFSMLSTEQSLFMWRNVSLCAIVDNVFIYKIQTCLSDIVGWRMHHEP